MCAKIDPPLSRLGLGSSNFPHAAELVGHPGPCAGQSRALVYLENSAWLKYDTKHLEQRFGRSDSHVDVIVLEQDSGSEGGIASRHLQSVPELVDHLKLRCHGASRTCGQTPSSPTAYLVEDLSPEVTRLLGGFLDIPHQVFVQHLSSGETWKHSGHVSADRCSFSCPVWSKRNHRKRFKMQFNKELYSFTWWRNKTCNMDVLRNLGKYYLDCNDERVAFRNMALPFDINSVIPGDAVVKTRIFRPFHIIGNCDDRENIYHCAAEEQITVYEKPLIGPTENHRLCKCIPILQSSLGRRRFWTTLYKSEAT